MIFYGTLNPGGQYVIWDIEKSARSGKYAVFVAPKGGTTTAVREARRITEDEAKAEGIPIIPGDKMGKLSFFSSLPLPEFACVCENDLDSTFLVPERRYLNPLNF